MIEHPNAITSWTTVRMDRDRNLEVVLVVETDLAVSELEDDYDAEKFLSLVDAVYEFMVKKPNINRADVSRIQKN